MLVPVMGTTGIDNTVQTARLVVLSVTTFKTVSTGGLLAFPVDAIRD